MQRPVAINEETLPGHMCLPEDDAGYDDACLAFHVTERPIESASSEQARQTVSADDSGTADARTPALDCPSVAAALRQWLDPTADRARR